ncbi:MAG TPA: TAXI family TRAP transporter solute-binding subunit [Thermoanaerobaculia bacterium]|nr:TAXI family TRAP transporter solute-binding subunit [Thermoanaerobaculia bacterium]
MANPKQATASVPISMSRPTALVAAALVAGMFLGCGGGTDSADPSATGGRRFLSLGTAPPGGAFFVVGGALADVLNTRDGWQVTAEATKGSQENIRRLARGELDFALSNAAITYFAVRGTEGWEQAYPMRSVMTLAPNVGLFVAPQSSPVKALADLRGRRVVVGPAGAGFEYFLKPLLGAHGVRYEDFTPLNNTQTGTVDMLTDGSAAAAFLGGAIPTASITQASSSLDLHFVPFESSQVAGVVAQYPFFQEAVIPAGTYRGLDQDFQALDVGSMHLITGADVPDDLVYEVTKAIWDLRDQVTSRHPAGRDIRADNVTRDVGTEFHPGAVRFYREIGIWPAAGSGEEAATPSAASE